eukprot:90112-Hanusia_phi.AAC.3
MHSYCTSEREHRGRRGGGRREEGGGRRKRACVRASGSVTGGRRRGGLRLSRGRAGTLNPSGWETAPVRFSWYMDALS